MWDDNMVQNSEGSKQIEMATTPNNALSKWRQSELGSLEEILSDSPKI